MHLDAIISQIAYKIDKTRDIFETITALRNTNISILERDYLKYISNWLFLLMLNCRIRKLIPDISVSINIELKELLQTTLMKLNSFTLDFDEKMI